MCNTISWLYACISLQSVHVCTNNIASGSKSPVTVTLGPKLTPDRNKSWEKPLSPHGCMPLYALKPCTTQHARLISTSIPGHITAT